MSFNSWLGIAGRLPMRTRSAADPEDRPSECAEVSVIAHTVDAHLHTNGPRYSIGGGGHDVSSGRGRALRHQTRAGKFVAFSEPVFTPNMEYARPHMVSGSIPQILTEMI